MGGKVYFIGAGPGDPDLLTVKASKIIARADVIIWADSLINPAVLELNSEAEVHKSASLNLEQTTQIIVHAVSQGKIVARLQSGDPAIYGAIREQMQALDEHGIEYEVIPGVSSVFASAAALKVELTFPEVSQTVILTRREGRTPVPENESLKSLAKHQATMAIYLSAGQIENVVKDLLLGGYQPETPVAVVYRASWPDQQIVRGTLSDIAEKVKAADITRQALILVGKAIDTGVRGEKSKLYDKTFAHGYRQGEA